MLIDSGSMANFNSESCAHRLGLPRRRLSIPIEGLNGMNIDCIKDIVQCHIIPKDKHNPAFYVKAIFLSQLRSDQPKVLLNLNQ